MSAVVYAVANQKGGVVKTTTALALGPAWAERDLAVLAVDLDPQASLSYSLGEDPDAFEASVHDVLTGANPAGGRTPRPTSRPRRSTSPVPRWSC